MDWFSSINLFLGSLVAALHLLSLILLFSIKKGNMNCSQKYLLISLCLTEFCFGISVILRSILHFLGMINGIIILHIFELTPLFLVYLMIMIFITVDRLLVFRLNIKYSLYWSSKKTLIVLIIVFIVSISISIGVITLKQFLAFEYRKFFKNYILVPLAVLFMILASYTYYLIFKKLKENRIKNEKRKQSLRMQTSQPNAVPCRRTYWIFVPSLIIATFILFTIIPYILLTVYFSILDKYENLYYIIQLIFPLGWVADAAIYIFSLKQIRKNFRRFYRLESSTKK